eukprot:TRINITY_DN5132_c0_g1_i1.p1 TRINITY_DN5132_c0_g1~~TRINITY_DN5132_c0_g1_i1.p1  ORF type:complete len:558 (-),score=101.44 TRINITY_DN5132_c0_g1_i1:136-1809(-)
MGYLNIDKSNLGAYLFNAIDSKKLGKAGFFDFLRMMMTLTNRSRSLAQEKSELGFRLFDIDKDGAICMKDVQLIVQAVTTTIACLGLKSPLAPIDFVKKFCDILNLTKDSDTINVEQYTEAVLANEKLIRNLGSPTVSLQKAPVPTQIPGRVVFFGTSKWDFMLTLMVGIQASIDRRPMMGDNTDKMFSFQNKLTLPNNSILTDVAPHAFQKLREKFGLEDADYLSSLGVNQLMGSLLVGDLSTLSEMGSEGKSGSFFYWSYDGRYMVKTITSSEVTTFKRMLPKYYDYMISNPDTLLARIFGLYKLRIDGNVIRFVIMGSIFDTDKEIHQRFDLKGSTIGRTVGEEAFTKKGVVYKDLDFIKLERKINVGPKYSKKLMEQIRLDAAFLQSQKIIDYSLLVGAHQTGRDMVKEKEEWVQTHKFELERLYRTSRSAARGRYFDTCTIDEFCRFAYYKSSSSRPGIFITQADQKSPTLNSAFQQDWGGMNSSRWDEHGEEVVGEEVLFLGIIDILISFTDIKKQAENAARKRVEGKDISVIPPDEYGPRFVKFVCSAIV